MLSRGIWVLCSTPLLLVFLGTNAVRTGFPGWSNAAAHYGKEWPLGWWYNSDLAGWFSYPNPAGTIVSLLVLCFWVWSIASLWGYWLKHFFNRR